MHYEQIIQHPVTLGTLLGLEVVHYNMIKYVVIFGFELSFLHIIMLHLFMYGNHICLTTYV